jgi:hypothetical protein
MRPAQAHKKMAHELVAETAKEMAGAWYEEAAHDDEFYAFYPSQNKFIKREWHRFIEQARQTLASMLGRVGVDEWQKEQIFDALLKHASIPGNMDPRVAKKVFNLGDGQVAMVH